MEFLFEIAKEPIYAHPLWAEHEQAVPSLRIDCRFTSTQDGQNNWNAATGPADTVYAFMTRMARYIDRFGPTFGPRNRAFRWFGIPAAFGGILNEDETRRCTNSKRLLGHPSDALKSGRRGPFAKVGIELNRAWSREMLEHLADECKSRGLPDPIAFILTSENNVGDDYEGHRNTPDTGWVPEALRDPRATDPAHTIDGVRTFAQYYRDARALDGGPIPEYRDDLKSALPPGRHPLNSESSERYRGAIRLLNDYARDQAFGSIARDAFRRANGRTVLVGEYTEVCDSKDSPTLVRPGTRRHQMDGRFRCDLQCPSWYGDFGWLYNEDVTRDDPGWETLTNWARHYRVPKLETAEGKVRLALEVAVGMAEANARACPKSRLCPFVFNGPGVSVEIMSEYITRCRAVGAWGVVVFMPEPTPEDHDFWKKVIERVNG